MLNVQSLKPALTRAFGRTSLKVQKFSPEILTAAGVIGIVSAGVMASRATLKLNEVLTEHRDDLALIKEVRVSEKADEIYPEDVANRDTAVVYVRTAVNLVKLYGPAITLGAVSILSIVSAQGILKKRNVALAAAYKTLETTFAEYRERVIEEMGEEEELKVYRPVKEEVVENEETGKEETITTPIPGYSQYAKVFDELSGQWQKNADYNLHFLVSQQTYFNELLHARGHVFLNEVYDALDIPRTAAGQFVGWVRGNGDDFIDFGIHKDHKDPNKAAFINGLERSILLDFNVDGAIYDLI